ncbi:unnamed protein product [Dibothriocephalus latus]|uniref:Uncharacterized protein n=1 Tax=Dibothriocephalus latus TaxID=60516 RepID=A0A3P7NQB4_DIBLA|nr:unnamed protein product [Dibothriocephalus latus]
MTAKVPQAETFFDCLSTKERTGVRCLRLTHFLLARAGLFQSICLMFWLAERAAREKEPPIHPWIIYGHVNVSDRQSRVITVTDARTSVDCPVAHLLKSDDLGIQRRKLTE